MKTPIFITTSDNAIKNTADPANMFGTRPGIKTNKTEPKTDHPLFGEKGDFIRSRIIRWGVHGEDID